MFDFLFSRRKVSVFARKSKDGENGIEDKLKELTKKLRFEFLIHCVVRKTGSVRYEIKVEKFSQRGSHRQIFEHGTSNSDSNYKEFLFEESRAH